MKKAICILIGLMFVLSACGHNSSPTADAGTSWQEQYDLGVRYLEEGNYEEAIIAFNAAIEIDPKQAPAYVGRGDAHSGAALLAAGDFEELPDEAVTSYQSAVEDYLAAIELDETKAEVYLKAAEVYIELGDQESAMSILLEGHAITGDEALLTQLQELGYIPDDAVVEWSDPVLERMLREVLNKPEGDILAQDLDSITDLAIYGDTYCFINNEDSQMNWRYIAENGKLFAFYGQIDENGQGPQYTTRGSLTNIDSLRYFRNLDGVMIIANQVADISVFNSMHLSWANLWANKISDLSPLDKMNLEDTTAQLNREQFVEIGAILPAEY